MIDVIYLFGMIFLLGIFIIFVPVWIILITLVIKAAITIDKMIDAALEWAWEIVFGKEDEEKKCQHRKN